MKKRLMALVISLVLVLVGFPAFAEQMIPTEYVGDWAGRADELGIDLRFTIREDGTGAYTFQQNRHTETGDFTVSLDGSTLSLVRASDGIIVAGSVALSGEELTVSLEVPIPNGKTYDYTVICRRAPEAVLDDALSAPASDEPAGLFGTAEDFEKAYIVDQRPAAPMLYAQFANVPCDVPIEQAHISCFNYRDVSAQRFADYGVHLAKLGYRVTASQNNADVHTYTLAGNDHAFEIRYDTENRTLRETWRHDLCASRTIDCGFRLSAAIRADGTMAAVGENYYGQCDVSDWSDVAAVACGRNHIVMLKADSTAAAVGDNDKGQCDVSGWSDLAAVACGAYHTVGLKADGTIVTTGDDQWGQYNAGEWTDVVAVTCGGHHTVGLKADGTVAAVGENERGQCDVSDWTDIVAVAGGDYHTVGLKSDGTMVAVGGNYVRQCNVRDWTDVVAVACGDFHTVGFKSDGTVVAVGDNDKDQCDVSDWSDLVAVACGWAHTIGLKADGTAVAVGNNDNGQCDVAGCATSPSGDTGPTRTTSKEPTQFGKAAQRKCVAVGDKHKARTERSTC